MCPSEQLRRTPLYDVHVALGGRLVPFSGWEMPIQYGGILDEARAVRSRSGLFDVSHMGRLDIRGPGAAELLSRVLSVDVGGLRMGRAKYNVICDQEGGIIDDCIVYRRGDDRFLLIPNASNTDAVLAWLERWNASGMGKKASISNVTSEFAMIAHQGPQAVDILNKLAEVDVSTIRPFRAVETVVAGADALLARTGYTGEDGFEMILSSSHAAGVWTQLIDAGATPCGLGSRDVLRLEAGLLLHGNDMDTSINPYEAGLDRFVDPDREGYVAHEALTKARDGGVSRRLVGFKMVDRGIPRHGYAIKDGPEIIGEVSSGSHSPTLDTSIGLGYVPTGYTAVGSRFQVDIRGRLTEAEVTTLPFYSRRRDG